jgi:hypothetical protein
MVAPCSNKGQPAQSHVRAVARVRAHAALVAARDRRPEVRNRCRLGLLGSCYVFRGIRGCGLLVLLHEQSGVVFVACSYGGMLSLARVFF